ncbi:uncharacterized protein LOC131877757 [Tigriopus californicus]|uniref:uncharacterized protein LOC131877757 n=1 Tax=Tigriopus californicus TaxID=6832 RepID=UPI0027D9DE95|nr:uncharacterized protein LOC131877757 [Tigriopus californicus]
MGEKLKICLLALSILGANALDLDIKDKSSRLKKQFGLFNVIQFDNQPCQIASSNSVSGTCFSASDCQARSGLVDGNCASGFGVCCVFMLTSCGGTVTQNTTFVRNPGYPQSDTSGIMSCTYTLNRIVNNVVQIRLDFIDVVTNAMGPLPGACGGTADSITVTSPFSASANAFPPTICGTLTGQHMYFETGSTGLIAGTMTIAKGTTGTTMTTPGVTMPMLDRRFNIQVTYLTPGLLIRAPPGCTQYFTEFSGTIQSYNFAGGQLLETQMYDNCIRRHPGFCSYRVMQSNPTSFSLSGDANVIKAMAKCMGNNHIIIPNDVRKTSVAYDKATKTSTLMSVSFGDLRCGQILSAFEDDSMPGSVQSDLSFPLTLGVRTLRATDQSKTALQMRKGFSVDYTLVAC